LNRKFAFDDSQSVFSVGDETGTNLVQQLRSLLPVVVVRHGGTNTVEWLSRIFEAVNAAFQTHTICCDQLVEVLLGDRESIDLDVETFPFRLVHGDLHFDRFHHS